MIDFLNGLSGGITSILPTFGGLTQGAGNLFSGFLGDNKSTGNMQQAGGNYLLDNMTPEVAGVFQGMGVNVDPSSIGSSLQPTQQGLLNQGSVNIQAPQAPVFNAPQMPVYNQRQQITPVDLQQYYRNLMSSRQGIL
jgi:hypothetical protein